MRDSHTVGKKVQQGILLTTLLYKAEPIGGRGGEGGEGVHTSVQEGGGGCTKIKFIPTFNHLRLRNSSQHYISSKL